MVEMPITIVRAHWSEVLRRVETGEEIIVTRGAKKEPVAAIIPFDRTHHRRGLRIEQQRIIHPLVPHDAEQRDMAWLDEARSDSRSFDDSLHWRLIKQDLEDYQAEHGAFTDEEMRIAEEKLRPYIPEA